MVKQSFYRGPAFDTLHEEYAKKGRLDDQAPVQSSSNIYINAPVERVWGTLIDLHNWPVIDPSTRDERLKTGAVVDAHFDFKWNGFPINAEFAVIHPYRELHRTGSSLWFKAIDLHALEPAHENGTQLYIAESFAEFLASLFISSEKLRIQHEKWLTAIRRAAENGQ